jgi:hypothetical protein
MAAERHPLAHALDIQLRGLERDEEDDDRIATPPRLAQHLDLRAVRHDGLEGEADALLQALAPRRVGLRLRAAGALLARRARQRGIDLVGIDVPA